MYTKRSYVKNSIHIKKKDDSSTSAFLDDGSFPFGGRQLSWIVLVVVNDLNAVQLARRATQFGYEPLVDGVEIALEQGVVAGRIARVLVMAVRRELCIVTITFAHENVNLARFEYPIETGQLAKVDLE